MKATNQKLPNFITFTGIDDRTDLTKADTLASQYPIEWGVLFSPNSRDARYPSNQAVEEILDISGKKSAHLCGQIAQVAARGIVHAEVPLWRFDRTQINGENVATECFPELESQFGVQVIRQTREAFNPQTDFLELYDCSRGEGLLPETVPPLGGEGTLVGYAGGMGPETVIGYLKMIQGEGEYWIDMEARIRTNGWFDLDKVQRVCELVYG